jgi:hypothetical protein
MLFEVFVHPGGECRHFVGELWQRGGVAFGQLADAAGEGLRDAVQLALHGGGEVASHLSSTTRVLISSSVSVGILGVELGVQVLLRGLELGLGVGLLVEQAA